MTPIFLTREQYVLLVTALQDRACDLALMPESEKKALSTYYDRLHRILNRLLHELYVTEDDVYWLIEFGFWNPGMYSEKPHWK